MRYELNFDEDKIIDIEAIGDDGVLDLKDCCKIMNEQQATIEQLKEEEKLYAQEILRLNTLLKQYQANQDLGGGY